MVIGAVNGSGPERRAEGIKFEWVKRSEVTLSGLGLFHLDAGD